jgi:hypothetical protein
MNTKGPKRVKVAWLLRMYVCFALTLVAASLNCAITPVMVIIHEYCHLVMGRIFGLHGWVELHFFDGRTHYYSGLLGNYTTLKYFLIYLAGGMGVFLVMMIVWWFARRYFPKRYRMTKTIVSLAILFSALSELAYGVYEGITLGLFRIDYRCTPLWGKAYDFLMWLVLLIFFVYSFSIIESMFPKSK